MREIKTNFMVEEKVYMMSENKVVQGEILSLSIYEDKKILKIDYEVRIGRESFSTTVPESKLFKTKQELLNSL